MSTFTEQELTTEEKNELSGYQSQPPEYQAELVDPQYSLLNEESGEVRDASERGPVRLAVVGVLVAILLGMGWIFWKVISPKSPPREPVKAKVQPEKEEEQRELDGLKAELALRGQASQSEEETGKLAIREQPETLAKPSKVKPVQPVKAVSVPLPRTPVRRVNFPPHPPVSLLPLLPLSKSPPVIVDPYKRWQEIATLGYSSAGAINWDKVEEEKLQASSSESESPIDLANTKQTSNSSLPKGTIGKLPQRLSGAEGILSRTSVNDTQRSGTTKEVALGTSVRAVVKVPLIWTREESPTDGRFVVQLSEDMRATDGTIALAAGTLIVVQVKGISDKGIVLTEAIALVKGRQEGTEEIPISAGAVSILGEGNSPLLAQGYFDPGGDIAKQDFLMGAIGALARVGKIVNQPDEEVTVTDGGTVIAKSTKGEPDLMAAALEGFFTPLSEAMQERSQAIVQELMSRENIAVLPEGMEVSVLVKSFLTVEQ